MSLIRKLWMPVSIAAVAACSSGGGGGTDPDTEAPTGSVTRPGIDTTITGPVALEVADADDNRGVTKVEYYDGSILIGSATSAPYRITFTPPTGNTSHNITAKLYDAVPNVGVTGVRRITANVVGPDVTPPSVTTLTPASGTLLPAGTTSQLVTAGTDENADCRESSSASTPYASMTAMGGNGTKNHTLNLANLVDGQHVPVYILCRDAAGNLMTTPAQTSFDVDTPVVTTRQLRIQLVDMDGNPVTQQHSMPIDGVMYNANASGLITAQVTQGTHTIGYARAFAGDTTATRLELPASYQQNVRIIFPRFKINQAAPAGQDTLTVNQDTDARAVIAGLGSNFNKEHYSGYFDDPIVGQQGIRGNTVRFHILTQPNAQLPLCQAMSAGALSTYRQFQQTQSTDLASNYAVVNTEGTTLPATFDNGEHVILCQGPIVGNETFRDSNGLFTFSVAYVGAAPTVGEINTESLLAVYGSSGIEGKCVVSSVFNDPNILDPTCSLGSTTPTAYDRREGLDMMKTFAQPANARAVTTSTTGTGNFKIYFSTRQ